MREKIKTNADVIREFDNEMLAEFIQKVELGDLDYSVTFCDYCQKYGNILNLDCDGCLKHWLNSPVNEIFGLFNLNRIDCFVNEEEYHDD